MAYRIDPADEPMLAEIETWLDIEEANYQLASQEWKEGGYRGNQPVQGFRCNWDSVVEEWREGLSKIHCLVVNCRVVGFLDGTDILEIHPDNRGLGYGRILSDFMLQLAWEQGRSVVKIEIARLSAKPFWKQMGFTVVEDRGGCGDGKFAYKILDRTFDLGDGDRVRYAVSYFNKEARYSQNPKPFLEFAGVGERLSDGRIQLPERAYCFNPIDGQHVDYFVKILVDGEVIHFHRAKCDESELCGVRRDAGGDFYIECINPSHRGGAT